MEAYKKLPTFNGCPARLALNPSKTWVVGIYLAIPAAQGGRADKG